MFSDEWLRSSSLFYGFDPRLKIVLVFAFSVLVSLARTWPCLAAATGLALFAGVLADLPLLATLKRLIPVNGMVLFLWLMIPFSVPGDPLFSVSVFQASSQGMDLALAITAKANILMLMFIAFVASTPVATIGHALSRLGIPSKLVHLFFFTYRYIQVIHDEYQRLKTAMLVRGFVPRTSLHTYTSYAYLVGMLIVKSSNRAEQVYRAMVCRGFDGRLYSLHTFSIGTKDRVLSGLMGLWMFAMGWMEWMGRLD